MPKSPKVTVVPPLAFPVMRPRCCLRCLTLRGMSISVHLPAEVRRLVVLVAAATLHLLVLGEPPLELVGLRRRGDQIRESGALLLGLLRRLGLRLCLWLCLRHRCRRRRCALGVR